jgi:hypothetical protein
MTLKAARRWLERARKRLWATLGKLRNVRERYHALIRRRHEAEVGSNTRATLARRVRHFRHRVAHLARTRDRRAKEKDRLARKVKWLADHKDQNQPAGAIGHWDGRQVAGWMVGAAPGPGGERRNWLYDIQQHSAWGGGLYSGYRSPEYSESLCLNMCGRPSCPGLCAGRSSNHSGLAYPGGAIDVVDWVNFQIGNDRIRGPFTNNLPADRPHRSASGY